MFFSYYWPYTFPTSTVATASIYYAAQEQTRSSECLAMVLVGFSVLVLMLVIARDAYHAYEVHQGRGNWDDAIVARFLAQQKAKEEKAEYTPEKGLVADVDVDVDDRCSIKCCSLK